MLGFRLVGALVLLQVAAYASAYGATSDASAISIDGDQFPIIELSANHAPLAEVLTQLSTRLGFTIEHLPTDSRQTVTTTLRGELGDLLRSDALGRLNFLLIGNGTRVERLIFLGPEPRADAPSANGAAGPPREPRREFEPAAVTPLAAAAAPPVGSPTAAAISGKVNRLLRAQAMLGSAQTVAAPAPAPAFDQRTASATAASASASASADSLAASTRTAMMNVSTLSAALQSLCVGPSCGH